MNKTDKELKRSRIYIEKKGLKYPVETSASVAWKIKINNKWYGGYVDFTSGDNNAKRMALRELAINWKDFIQEVTCQKEQ